MTTTRRQFLDHLAVGGLAMSALPLTRGTLPTELTAIEETAQGTWDTKWGSRLTGRVKALFDVPEVESGFGVWRASIWSGQYEQVLGVPANQTSTALVLRHNAIILAMQQAFWDRYGIGKSHKAMHPLTGEATDRNPALMGASDGVPEPFNTFSLDKFLTRGGVCLACNLALQFDIVPIIKAADGVTDEKANEQARGWLVPGVILQPSGMFAVFRAQEAGAYYFRAT